MLGGLLHLDIFCVLLYLVSKFRNTLNRFRIRRKRESRPPVLVPHATSPRHTHLPRSKSCSSLPRISRRRFRSKPEPHKPSKHDELHHHHHHPVPSTRPPTDIEHEDVELDDEEEEFGEGEETPWSTASSMDASTLSSLTCLPSLASFPSTALCAPPITGTIATVATVVADSDERAKQLLLINIKHKCIAEQLTLIMHDVYRHIPFDEHKTCSALQADSSNYYTASYTKLFNDTVNWIQYSILSAMDSKQRASMIKKWIKCAAYLLSMRNFHALVAVHCALTSNIVYSGRLNVAWFEYRNILKAKHHRKFRQIAQIVNYKNNYSLLRTATDAELKAAAASRVRSPSTRTARTPILPYWGIFKRDVQAATECKNGAQIICKLKQRYEAYKQGEYVDLKRNDTIRTWIHYQLHETSCIDQQAMHRMADNVREHDREKWNERKRRYSLKAK